MSSCASSSELSSSWINEPEKKNMITFDLPATDFELVQQVFEFIDDNPDVNRGDILIRMARKYRFAGYIGTIEFLSAEVRELREEVQTLRQGLRQGPKVVEFKNPDLKVAVLASAATWMIFLTLRVLM